MRPAEVLRRATDYLSHHDVESPLPTAEVLLAQILGTDRAGLYARDEGLSSAEAKRFGRALCRRCVGVPLQHLTGEQVFRRLTLLVRPGVFIPRPETEILVEHALASIEDVSAPVVVDVGTGTGAIGLAIKTERPDARVVAIDISEDAIALARTNADLLALDVEIVEGDLLDPLMPSLRGAVDLIVSNPPYVAADELETLPPDARADPVAALVGGIDLYERLFAQAAEVLRARGAVVVEIGDAHGEVVCEAASAAGFVDVGLEQDLAGRDRVVGARKPG
ncbi:MAG: peptide chain release factor N(5)-glutamine methyltransferase [Actinomycetota bacterium]